MSRNKCLTCCCQTLPIYTHIFTQNTKTVSGITKCSPHEYVNTFLCSQHRAIGSYKGDRSAQYIVHIAVQHQEKFVATLEVIVKRKTTYTVTVDEQWLSEKEMKDELKWSQRLDLKGCIYTLLSYTGKMVFERVSMFTSFVWVFVALVLSMSPSLSLAPSMTLRSRINGAKKICDSKKDTHIRTFVSPTTSYITKPSTLIYIKRIFAQLLTHVSHQTGRTPTTESWNTSWLCGRKDSEKIRDLKKKSRDPWGRPCKIWELILNLFAREWQRNLLEHAQASSQRLHF